MRYLIKRRTGYAGPRRVHAYHNESMMVLSSNPCLSCHRSPHNHVSGGYQFGIGTPGANLGIGVDERGRVVASANISGGISGGASVAYDPNPGPHIRTSGPRQVTLSGSHDSGPQSARQDKTRTGG